MSDSPLPLATPNCADPQADAALRAAGSARLLDILYEVATILGQPGSLEELLEAFLEAFAARVEARAASVRLVTGDGHTRLAASRGLEPASREADQVIPIERCACGWSAADGRVRVEPGVAHCAQAIGRPIVAGDCAEFVAVPIRYQDRVLGVYNLFLDRPLASLGEDMPELLASVGRHLGLAIEKSRLEGESRRLAIMEERNIIGNELHDSLAQSLVGMRLQVKMLSESLGRGSLAQARCEVAALRRAMTQADADLRSLLTNYRLKIGEQGLVATVQALVERFRGETGVAVFFQNQCRTLALTPAQEIQVFYIVQEALTNIRKHSRARNVRVMFNNEDDLYTVLIEDDGLGMADPDDPLPAEHAGIDIMRERTARLPGQFVMESEPGEGTRIILIFNAPPGRRGA